MDLAFSESLLLSPSSDRSSSPPVTVLPATFPTLSQSKSTLDTLSPDQNEGLSPNLEVHQPPPGEARDRRKRRPRVQPAAAGAAPQLSDAVLADGGQEGAATPAWKERTLLCAVCGDEALGYNYDCISCESCKSFFRRNAFQELKCSNSKNGECSINLFTRRQCSACRLAKCLAVGMNCKYILKDSRRGIGVLKRHLQAPAAARPPDRPKRKYRRRQLAPSRDPPVGAANASAGMGEEAAAKGGSHPSSNSSASTGVIPNEYGDEGLTKAGVQIGQQMQLQEVMAGNGREHASRQANLRFHESNDSNESCGGNEKRTRIERAIIRSTEPDPPPADTQPHNSHRSHASLMQHSRVNHNHANPVCLFRESHPEYALISTHLRESQVHMQQIESLLDANQYPAGESRKMETTQTQVPNIPLSWNSVEYPFGTQVQCVTDNSMSTSFCPAALVQNISHETSSQDDNAVALATGSGREPFDVNMGTVRGTPCYWKQDVPLRQTREAILNSELRRAPPDIRSPVQQTQPLLDLKVPAAMSSHMSSRHAAPTPEGSIQQQCDPRARQNADSALVSHTLCVEPIFDSQYDLRITTEARCFSFTKSITVSVPHLSPEEFHATLSALRAARAATRRPLSPDEAGKLPRQPSNAFEYFSYAEHCMRRAICGLKLMPDFRALNNDDQTTIVKTTANAILRVLPVFQLDPVRISFIHPVSIEYISAGHWDDVERELPIIQGLSFDLQMGFVEETALLINCSNYSLSIHANCGEDEVIIYLLMLLNIFSPHRFLSDAHILASVAPIHAKLLQFLRQYLQAVHPQLVYSSSESTSTSDLFPNECTASGTSTELVPDFEHSTLLGMHLPALEALSPELRERLQKMLFYPRIEHHIDRNLLASLGLVLEPMASLRSDWRWLFAFCVAALNDIRVDEVSQRDYEMRRAISNQYTPLILELFPDSSSRRT